MYHPSNLDLILVAHACTGCNEHVFLFGIRADMRIEFNILQFNNSKTTQTTLTASCDICFAYVDYHLKEIDLPEIT